MLREATIRPMMGRLGSILLFFNIIYEYIGYHAECAPSQDHRAPAVPRLVPKAGADTGLNNNLDLAYKKC